MLPDDPCIHSLSINLEGRIIYFESPPVFYWKNPRPLLHFTMDSAARPYSNLDDPEGSLEEEPSDMDIQAARQMPVVMGVPPKVSMDRARELATAAQAIHSRAVEVYRLDAANPVLMFQMPASLTGGGGGRIAAASSPFRNAQLQSEEVVVDAALPPGPDGECRVTG